MSGLEQVSQPLHQEDKEATSRSRQTSWAAHQSTSDGDVLYDDSSSPSRNRNRNNRDSKAKSNNIDGHVRSLSGRFFDATNLNISPDNSQDNSDNSICYSPDPEPEELIQADGNVPLYAYPTQEATNNFDYAPTVGKKHRRGCSGGKTNPVMAHRRINSGGEGAFIHRQNNHGGHGHVQQYAHDGHNRISRDRLDGRAFFPENVPSSNLMPTKRSEGPPLHEIHHGYNGDSRSTSRSSRDRSPLDYFNRVAPNFETNGYDPHRYPNQYVHVPQQPPQQAPQQAPQMQPSHSNHPANYQHHQSAYDDHHQTRQQEEQYHYHRQHHNPPPPHHPPHRHPALHIEEVRSGNFPPNNYYQNDQRPSRAVYPLPRLSSRSSSRSPSPRGSYPVQSLNESKSGHPASHRFPPPGSRPLGHPSQLPRDGTRPPGQGQSLQPPSHPLVGEFGHHLPPPVLSYRQTSHSSVDSDKIYTDEALFAKKYPGEVQLSNNNLEKNREDFKSSPQHRISPQLFEDTLKDYYRNESGQKYRASPPEALLSTSIGSLGSDPGRFPHHRQSSSLSSPQMKEFMRDVEHSQGHERSNSSASFILDDNLFGENLLPVYNDGQKNTSKGEASADAHDKLKSALSDSLTARDRKSNSYDSGFVGMPPPPTLATVNHLSIPQAPLSSSSIPPLPSLSTPTLPTPPLESRNLKAALSTESNGTKSGSDASSSTRGKSSTGPKRARRKCTIADCTNRVVQGGLCIAHGAKRKTCGHPGCKKHVKKAGMCSAHGPPRKLCEVKGCSKVSVQGGKCIAHGAKKRLCSVDKCKKQAILSGMCKKHHDEHNEDVDLPKFCLPAGTSPVRTHERGLSVFEDLITVDKIINNGQI